MEKAVVYPFTTKVVPFIDDWNQNGNLPHIVSAVTIQPQGFAGQDVNALYNRDAMGVSIHIDLEEELKKYDTLMVTEVARITDSIRVTILKNMEIAILQKKNVICNAHLSDNEIEDFMLLAKQMNVVFFYNANNDYLYEKKEYLSVELYTFETPIVMVGGLYEELDNTDVVLAIKRNMKARGYRAVAVLEESNICSQDMFSYNHFFKIREYDENEKVFSFNSFMKIEIETNPDLIVLQMSRALIKYNNSHCNGFGIIPFMITQAVSADYFVFCVPLQKIEVQFYNELSRLFEYRFGCGVDYIHMSNAAVDERELLQSKELSLLYRTLEDVKNIVNLNYKNTNIPIGNCFIDQGIDKLCDHIIFRLSSYKAEI